MKMLPWLLWLSCGSAAAQVAQPFIGAPNRNQVNVTLGVYNVQDYGNSLQLAMSVVHAAGGGTIMVPDGTYQGPTTWFSNITLQAVHAAKRNLCSDTPLINCVIATSATDTNGVVLTYTASLTLTDLTRLAVFGMTLDFGGNGCLTLAGINYSQFDMTIRNASITCAALKLTNSTNNNTAFNLFYFLQIGGGNEGILCDGAIANRFVTNNWFGTILIFETVAPAGTYTAIDFKRNCDTNTLDWVLFVSGQSAANGVVFNSQSTTTDQDANGIIIKYFVSSGGPFTTGIGITFNPSTGNFIRTGVLNWTTKVSIATGGPVNSPSFYWNQGDATVGTQSIITSNLFQTVAPNASASAGYQFIRGNNTLQWNWFVGGDNILHWFNGANSQVLGLDSSGTLYSGPLVSGTGTGLFEAGVLAVDTKSNFASTDVLTNSGPGGSAAKKLAIKAGPGQGTNNLQEWQNSSGTSMLGVGPSGLIVAPTATMGMALKKGSGVGNYTTASTAYVQVDGTNLINTVTIPTGWKLGVQVSGAITSATAVATVSVAITDAAAVLQEIQINPTVAGVAGAEAFSLSWVITGDGASHAVDIRFKTSNAADAATILNSSTTLLPTIVYMLIPSN